MAMKKKTASNGSDRGAKMKADNAQKKSQAKAASNSRRGQSYVDKRGTYLGFPYGDTAGFYAESPQSTKNLPMSAPRGETSQKFGPYGKTAKRGVDQAKRAAAKKADQLRNSRKENRAAGASRVKVAKGKK